MKRNSTELKVKYHKGNKPSKKFNNKNPRPGNMGQWTNPGVPTEIASDNITMQGVPYPVKGIDNFGNEQIMMPGADYVFPGSVVTEIPMAKSGGWLTKYQTKGNVNLTQAALNEANNSFQPSSTTTNVPAAVALKRDIDTGKVAANKKAAEEKAAEEAKVGPWDGKRLYTTIVPDNKNIPNLYRYFTNTPRTEQMDDASEEAWRIYTGQQTEQPKYFLLNPDRKSRQFNVPGFKEALYTHMLYKSTGPEKDAVYSKKGIPVNEFNLESFDKSTVEQAIANAEKMYDSKNYPIAAALSNFYAGIDTTSTPGQRKLWIRDDWDLDFMDIDKYNNPFPIRDTFPYTYIKAPLGLGYQISRGPQWIEGKKKTVEDFKKSGGSKLPSHLSEAYKKGGNMKWLDKYQKKGEKKESYPGVDPYQSTIQQARNTTYGHSENPVVDYVNQFFDILVNPTANVVGLAQTLAGKGELMENVNRLKERGNVVDIALSTINPFITTENLPKNIEQGNTVETALQTTFALPIIRAASKPATAIPKLVIPSKKQVAQETSKAILKEYDKPYNKSSDGFILTNSKTIGTRIPSSPYTKGDIYDLGMWYKFPSTGYSDVWDTKKGMEETLKYLGTLAQYGKRPLEKNAMTDRETTLWLAELGKYYGLETDRQLMERIGNKMRYTDPGFNPYYFKQVPYKGQAAGYIQPNKYGGSTNWLDKYK